MIESHSYGGGGGGGGHLSKTILMTSVGCSRPQEGWGADFDLENILIVNTISRSSFCFQLDFETKDYSSLFSETSLYKQRFNWKIFPKNF